MPAVGRFDRVHRQRADRIDRSLFDAFGDRGHELAGRFLEAVVVMGKCQNQASERF
jgi:hypothetical protein